MATLLLFTVLGPLIGSVAFLFAGVLKPAAFEAGLGVGLAAVLTAVYSPFAYFAGFLPAHITGWIVAMTGLEVRSSWRLVGIGAAAGAVSSLAVMLAFIGAGLKLVPYALAGCTGGLLCTVLVVLLRIRPRPS
ncbi:MAG: hypothetical protein AB7F96_19865 [Beijerinckiaceae bacterium]